MIKCLLLVEGPYDLQRLSILKDLFDENKLVLIPFGCDKLTEPDFYLDYESHIRNVLAKDKTYLFDDFDNIVQVCDTDGCFIDDKYILEMPTAKVIKYNLNSIEAISKEDIVERNHRKQDNIDSILNDNKISLYFNSTNIDHAFDNIQNPSKKKKMILAINMYNTYKNDYKKIISLLFVSNKLKSIDYESSWKDIRKGFNSLCSTSNLIFFIDKYQNELKEEVKIEYLRLKDDANKKSN